LRPYGIVRSARRAPRLAVLVGLLLVLTGCSSESRAHWRRGGLPEGITNQADRITTLWVGSWIAAMLVGIMMWGLILWAALVFRRRSGETGLPAQVRYNVPIEVLYTSVPLIIVLVFFYFTARDQSRILEVSDTADVKVDVVGKRWSWDFNYLDASREPVAYEVGTPGRPPTLYLPVNEPVEFTLSARDVIHSFWVPAFLFKIDTIPGRVNTFEITPTKEGEFFGKCAELCGVDHSRMLFNVRVVSRADYDAHLADLEERGQVGELPANLGPSTEREDTPPSEQEGQQ
jgi:cytochrome c oxidase subunit II